MRKKLFFILLIIALFVCVGIRTYQVTHSHARIALVHMQEHLQQLAGSKGHYTYSKVKISWFTQSIVIRNLDLSLSNGFNLHIRRLRITPETKDRIASLFGDGVHIKSPNLSIDITSVVFNGLTIPLFDKPQQEHGISFNDLLGVTYNQVFMHGVYCETVWAKLRLGRLKIASDDLIKKHAYVINNIDIAPELWRGGKAYFDALHFDQLIWEMSNNQQFSNAENIASFFTNTDFSIKGFGVVGFHKRQKRVHIDQLNTHLSRKRSMWGGEIVAKRLDYDLNPSSSLFAEYLKRIGYDHLRGMFQSKFTYYNDSKLFTLHNLDYTGDDFIGMKLQSSFYIDRAFFNMGIIDWTDNVLLKSVNLFLYNTGLKQHLFFMIASQSNQSIGKIEQESLQKFNEFASGKDFELDRDFYKALADIIQHPDRMMHLSISFAKEERISSLLNMNFIDFFKLINQNNIVITTEKHH